MAHKSGKKKKGHPGKGMKKPMTKKEMDAKHKKMMG